ncbi:MAG: tetratricopeptide repeat protein [Megasphaera sp.]|jgi:tetratricopeptide (TPR) repeat protein|nr:tetratricopeptide repeat protein [Megasphaera sp.]
MKHTLQILLAVIAGTAVFTASPLPGYARENLTAQQQMELQVRQGWEFFGKGLYPKAIAAFDTVLATDPANTSALKLRGLSYSFEKKYDAAIADYTTVLGIYNNGTTSVDGQGIYYDRALAYMELQQYDAAIADLTKALTYPSVMKPLYLERGNAYAAQKNYAQALADYGKQIDLFPDTAAAYEKRSALYRLDACKDEAAALRDYTSLIALQPDNALAYIHRYKTYIDLGNYDAALTDINTLLARNKKDTALYIDRGQVYATLNRTSDALADFTQAISLNNKAINAYRQRGKLYERMGNDKLAAKDTAKAAKLTIEEQKAIAAYQKKKKARQ